MTRPLNMVVSIDFVSTVWYRGKKRKGGVLTNRKGEREFIEKGNIVSACV
tara:strand:- start:8 stop:157 length:150 start_codon:yes stop_codon:yes gene_type:complete